MEGIIGCRTSAGLKSPKVERKCVIDRSKVASPGCSVLHAMCYVTPCHHDLIFSDKKKKGWKLGELCNIPNPSPLPPGTTKQQQSPKEHKVWSLAWSYTKSANGAQDALKVCHHYGIPHPTPGCVSPSSVESPRSFIITTAPQLEKCLAGGVAG